MDDEIVGHVRRPAQDHFMLGGGGQVGQEGRGQSAPTRPDTLIKTVRHHRKKGRVDLGGCPPRPPTDPDVRVKRIWLFIS